MADPTIIAPHPDMQHATYCYAIHGDGASARIVQGWEALCLLMEAEVGCGEDDRWRDLLADTGPDYWQDDSDGVPFYWHETFEDGSVTIYRMDAPAGVTTCGTPEVTDAMVDAYLKANDAYWKRTDELPAPPGKWRTGTPQEAVRESLRAALAAGVPGTFNDQQEKRDA